MLCECDLSVGNHKAVILNSVSSHHDSAARSSFDTRISFADEIRKSAGNAGIKTFTSSLDQGLVTDSITRGKVGAFVVISTRHSPL